MMTVECAVSMAYKRCARLAQIIEANESNWQSMDQRHRDEFGMIRCLMYTAGVARNRLPETPFLEEGHLKAYLERKAQHKVSREMSNEAHPA